MTAFKLFQVAASDSLNISERARRVLACLLRRTRGHGRQDIIPSGRRINNNTFDVSDGDVPAAAGPLGRGGKSKGTCSFFLFSFEVPVKHMYPRKTRKQDDSSLSSLPLWIVMDFKFK